MKVGFVLPRYGVEVHGGAETAARLLAEHLHERPGWSVEVFTTGALDAATWRDELPLGTSEVNGVPVHRFAGTERRTDFRARTDALLADPTSVPDADAREWIAAQGPVCPGALDAAAQSDCDLVTFHPYLYWPTVEGVARLGARAVLHPATHDEAPVRLPLFACVFAGAAGLAFWTEEERALAHRLFPAVVTHHQTVVGMGVDGPPPGTSAAAARASLGLGERPFLLCLGRVTAMKGTHALVDLFAAFRDRHEIPHALVFAGPVADAPPPHADVVVAGALDDATKWGLLAGADLLVSPSAYESLSLVLLEAWSAGTPVLVNGACDATREQARRASGGCWYDGFATFEVALERLLADAALRDHLAASGRAFLDAHCRWPLVIDRYTAFLQRVASPRGHASSS